MRLSKVAESLDVSRSSVDRYRKRLGIFNETKREVTEEQFEEMRKLRDRRVKLTKSSDKKLLEAKIIENSEKPEGELQIRDFDPVEVKNLKNQYNDNLKLMAYMTKLALYQMEQGKIPEKYLVDSIGKFQKGNIDILKIIRKLSPEEDELLNTIKERLASYD